MTFQQLEYIIAVDRSRHFVKAATECGVTQSTLSTTISKLEQEIDVIIFDRSKHPIEPTPMGKRIIQQAEIILHNSSQLRQMVQSEKEEERGLLMLGMITSVAPVLFPGMVRVLQSSVSAVEIRLQEKTPIELLEALQRSEIDIAFVGSQDLSDTNLLGIDLYTERFVVYASAGHRLASMENIRVEDLQDGEFWILREFHDRYPQLTEVTHHPNLRHSYLEFGSLHTLIQTVDVNGGYTLLPETFARCLTQERQQRVRKINSGKFFRTVTLAIRNDYMRERMLNVIINAIKRILPPELLSSRLANFERVKL